METSANYRCSSLFFPARNSSEIQRGVPIATFWSPCFDGRNTQRLTKAAELERVVRSLQLATQLVTGFPHQSIKSIEHPTDVIPRSKTEENMFDSFCRIFGIDALKTMEYHGVLSNCSLPGYAWIAAVGCYCELDFPSIDWFAACSTVWCTLGRLRVWTGLAGCRSRRGMLFNMPLQPHSCRLLMNLNKAKTWICWKMLENWVPLSKSSVFFE